MDVGTVGSGPSSYEGWRVRFRTVERWPGFLGRCREELLADLRGAEVEVEAEARGLPPGLVVVPPDHARAPEIRRAREAAFFALDRSRGSEAPQSGSA